MTFIIKDRVKETCTSPGTGTVTLLGASTGYSSFSTIGNANNTFYCIADQTGTNWEVGIGTYTSSGTTLSRDTVLANSLNTTTKINFASGTQDVFVTYPAEKSVNVGSGNNIQLDFSNATLLSRNSFQTSTVNGSTGIYALPNGTSQAASWQAANNADPTNASKILIATNGTTDVQLVSGINGTGTYLPLTFYNGGAEKMRLDTSGNFYVETGTFWYPCGTGLTISAATTLTLLQLQRYALLCSGTTYTVTLPTGTTIDAGYPQINATAIGFDFYVISTASGVITIAGNTGISTFGSLTVAAGTSAHFRLVRSGVNGYQLYRCS